MNNSRQLTFWIIDVQDSFWQSQSIYVATEAVARRIYTFLDEQAKQFNECDVPSEPYECTSYVYDTFSEFLEDYRGR